MKTRLCHVSNSSSSSFIVRGWCQLDKGICNSILHYRECVEALWAELGLPMSNEYDSLHLDLKACPDDMMKYDFGWLDGNWRFRIRENEDECEMTTVVDNFDMGRWLSYLGVEHDDLGETGGMFTDDEFDTSGLERFAELLRSKDAGGAK